MFALMVAVLGLVAWLALKALVGSSGSDSGITVHVCADEHAQGNGITVSGCTQDDTTFSAAVLAQNTWLHVAATGSATAPYDGAATLVVQFQRVMTDGSWQSATWRTYPLTTVESADGRSFSYLDSFNGYVLWNAFNLAATDAPGHYRIDVMIVGNNGTSEQQATPYDVTLQ